MSLLCRKYSNFSNQEPPLPACGHPLLRSERRRGKGEEALFVIPIHVFDKTKWILYFAAILLWSQSNAIGDSTGTVKKLVGTPAPEWSVTNWINSDPLELKNLRGKVVLVRWWTAPECPYCKATAPALNEFHEKYSTSGLQVVGFYHHKDEKPLRVADVKKYSQNFGFKFSVAIDPDWKTLHRWWLDRGDEQWTSVSFLIDRRGVIRHIHPGGEYIKGDKDYAALKNKIEELLTEKVP